MSGSPRTVLRRATWIVAVYVAVAFPMCLASRWVPFAFAAHLKPLGGAELVYTVAPRIQAYLSLAFPLVLGVAALTVPSERTANSKLVIGPVFVFAALVTLVLAGPGIHEPWWAHSSLNRAWTEGDAVAVLRASALMFSPIVEVPVAFACFGIAAALVINRPATRAPRP